MLQLGVPKIYGGSSRCVKHTKHVNHATSMGVCPPPPRKILILGVRRLNLEEILVVLAVSQKILFNTCLSCVRVTALLKYFDRD